MKESPYVFQRQVSLSPHCLHTFSRCISHDFSSTKPPPSDKSHKGKVSRQAQKRIEFLVNCLVLHALDKKYWSDKGMELRWFKVNFTTLTLPWEQQHSDSVIVSKCLNLFLQNCRNRFGLKNYLWKAETQANGRIHFHLTSDCYLPHKEIRKIWISCLEPLGYIDNFSSKFHHRNPPCTEVKRVREIKKLGRYLSKYFSKSEPDRRAVTCRIWSASESMQSLYPFVASEGDYWYEKLIKVDTSDSSVYFSQYTSSYYGELLKYFLPQHQEIIAELLAPMRCDGSCKYTRAISNRNRKQMSSPARTVEQAMVREICAPEFEFPLQVQCGK